MYRDRSHDRPGQGRAPRRVPKRATHPCVRVRLNTSSSFLLAPRRLVSCTFAPPLAMPRERSEHCKRSKLVR